MINSQSKQYQAAIAELTRECADYPALDYLGYYPERNRVYVGLSRASAEVRLDHGGRGLSKAHKAVAVARYADLVRASVRHYLFVIYRIDVSVQIRVVK